jgi:uncharacterized protein YcgL (UPF0745 family)
MSLPPRTVGDELLDEIRKISEAMVSLKQRGMPEAVIVLWIQKKTRMNQTDIKKVLDALREIFTELSKPAGR